MQFEDKYRNRRVLVTGHTGFKGSWLSLWLSELGAQVAGVALPPPGGPSHWGALGLNVRSFIQDIGDCQSVLRIVEDFQPEVVFHLAAQPLVRRSYVQPLETWSVNVLGTGNVLEACRAVPSVRAVICVTTDKCYENKEWEWGYRENDALGGRDPYSASKAAAELLVSSYRDSFFQEHRSPLVATARAGNVIGGGDWSVDRLIPDAIRAVTSCSVLEVRNPLATRPWQHVLESLAGYLILGQRLLEGNRHFSGAWNFGPDQTGNRSVADVLTLLSSHWSAVRWRHDIRPQPHEAKLLYLDSAKARIHLKWEPVWSFHRAVAETANWYKDWLQRGEAISRAQLAQYIDDAAALEMCWVTR